VKSDASGRVLPKLLFLLIVAGVAFLAVATLRLGPTPDVAIRPGLPAIGPRTPVEIGIDGRGRGFTSVEVELVQGTRIQPLGRKTYTPPPWWSIRSKGTGTDTLRVEVGRETVKGLQGTPGTIRVRGERAGTPLRSPDPVVREVTLPVRLTPPTLGVISTATYVTQGGSEAVVYRVGETSVKDGVEAGEWFFPGFPLPGGAKGDRFALFAVPYDMRTPSAVRVVAVDDVGNKASTGFIDRFTPDPPREDTIRLDEAFLGRVVPAILSQTPEITDRGGLLENFLAINGELRRANNAELRKLAAASRQEFLWTAPFEAMRGTGIMAHFADRRSYVLNGRVVDHQDHLGLDLAKTESAPIPAANDGVVVLARYLGIYGNAVVIDHGYGLMTLYGHLSAIDVKEGQQVRRGETLGRTGETGLAGGDHLHFAILLQGLSVRPREWIDGHWIRDRIARKLGPGMPFGAGAP
jgi:murein DD-endopeptidase MepM/ murein hydrolase activator NlpD